MCTARDAVRTRRFFCEVLALPHVRAQDGRPVFTHPPDTAGVRPAASAGRGSPLQLGCDQLGETVAELLCGGGKITAIASGPAPSVTMALPRFADAVTLHLDTSRPLRPVSGPRSGANA